MTANLLPGHVDSKEEWSLKKQLTYRCTYRCTCRSWKARTCHCNGYCACHYKKQVNATQIIFDANCKASAIYDVNQPALVYAGEHWEEIRTPRIILSVFENIPESTLAQGLEEYQRRFSTPPEIALICAVPLDEHTRRKWPHALAFGLFLENGRTR